MNIESTLPQWKKLAEQAAREAGDLLMERAANLLHINADEGKDVKLEADRAAERAIRKILKEESGLPVLGEEMGFDGTCISEGWQWIVDPLDGTANYLKNVPACCVSIALWDGLEPVLGVIYDFNSDELFVGDVLNGIATLNGHSIAVSTVADKSKAVLATGFPLAMNLESAELSGFIDKVQTFKKIRMIGSAALALAYVAAGRFDAYDEVAGRLWDVAAGVALIKAAGGQIQFEMTDLEGYVCDVQAASSKALMS